MKQFSWPPADSLPLSGDGPVQCQTRLPGQLAAAAFDADICRSQCESRECALNGAPYSAQAARSGTEPYSDLQKPTAVVMSHLEGKQKRQSKIKNPQGHLSGCSGICHHILPCLSSLSFIAPWYLSIGLCLIICRSLLTAFPVDVALLVLAFCVLGPFVHDVISNGTFGYSSFFFQSGLSLAFVHGFRLQEIFDLNAFLAAFVISTFALLNAVCILQP